MDQLPLKRIFSFDCPQSYEKIGVKKRKNPQKKEGTLKNPT